MRTTPAGFIVLAVAVSLALAACGGGSRSAGTGSGGARNTSAGAGVSALPIATTGASHLQLVRFARCMRAHGVPNFPDPDSTGEFSNYNVNPNAPAFQSADQKCTAYLPPGKQPSSAQVAQMNLAFHQLLRFAKCMRSHGVPNYPDPTRPAGGGVQLLIPDVNQNSPAFKHAQQDCSGLPGAPHPP